MSPEETGFFKDVGEAMLRQLTNTISDAILYGFFVFLFSFVFLKNKHSMHATSIATVLSFTAATIQIASNAASLTLLIRKPFMDNAALPSDISGQLVNDAIEKINTISSWADLVVPIMSDAIVIWRAWALYTERRWVMIFPLLLLLGTIVTSFIYGGILSRFTLDNTQDDAVYFAASLILSFATNALATSLIAYKLWIHRRLIIDGLTLGRSRVFRVLLLLVEFGFMYCTFQVIFIIIEATPVYIQPSALLVLNRVYFAFSAMYPTVVILLVNHYRSAAQSYEFSFLYNPGGYIPDMIAAPPNIQMPPIDSTTDNIGLPITTDHSQ